MDPAITEFPDNILTSGTFKVPEDPTESCFVTQATDNPELTILMSASTTIDSVVVIPAVDYGDPALATSSQTYSSDLKVELQDISNTTIDSCTTLTDPMTDPESYCAGKTAVNVKLSRDCTNCKLGICSVLIFPTACFYQTAYLGEDHLQEEYIVTEPLADIQHE